MRGDIFGEGKEEVSLFNEVFMSIGLMAGFAIATYSLYELNKKDPAPEEEDEEESNNAEQEAEALTTES
jgi:hypothetical protein